MVARTNRSFRDSWKSLPGPLCRDGIERWLRHRESLSERISSRCSRFEVHLLSQRRAAALPDEAHLLGLTRAGLVRVREVLLCADERAVVYARSLVGTAPGPWREWSALGERPLGELLFRDPAVSRSALAFKRLKSEDARAYAARLASGAQGRLWARRRSFARAGRPLLLTEVFLPAILELES